MQRALGMVYTRTSTVHVMNICVDAAVVVRSTSVEDGKSDNCDTAPIVERSFQQLGCNTAAICDQGEKMTDIQQRDIRKKRRSISNQKYQRYVFKHAQKAREGKRQEGSMWKPRAVREVVPVVGLSFPRIGCAMGVAGSTHLSLVFKWASTSIKLAREL